MLPILFVLLTFSIFDLRIINISSVLLSFPCANLRMADILVLLLTFSIVDFRIVDISFVLFAFASYTTRVVYICCVLLIFLNVLMHACGVLPIFGIFVFRGLDFLSGLGFVFGAWIEFRGLD